MSSETKMMTLEVLSSIKGATESEAVTELFQRIKEAQTQGAVKNTTPQGVNLESLREDHVEPSSETERNIIKANFPQEKNGYLVVPKVIEE